MVLEEVKQLLDRAEVAAKEFSGYSTDQVEQILEALGRICEEKAEFYAEWTVRETGFGDVADKTVKNSSCSVGTIQGENPADYILPKVDHEQKIISFPKPAGVVVALVPCTGPIMTVFYKAIISMMTRNAVILCPHPAAKECSAHAARLLAEVAESAGAPKDAIQTLDDPNIPLVTQLMQSPRTNLILATGGPGMVHAAYSSGTPAIGVGPGNVTCYVHESADIDTAAAQIVFSNSYDNALPCTCESVVLADSNIAEKLRSAINSSGGYFVEGEEENRLREYLFPEGVSNVEALGKSAQWIADKAGFAVPEGTKSLVVEIDSVGPHESVSKEKMFPVLGFTLVDGPEQAIDTVLDMLEMMGRGHSAAVHCNDPKVVASFGAALPVCRIAVNTPAIIGSSGVTTNLVASAIIGTGYFGGGSIDENVGPKQLIQWTRVAYHSEPNVEMGDMEGALSQLG